ncbi:MAG: MobP3 family relaxase [Clostridia bacterium]
MAKLIIKNGYIKSKNNSAGFVKYIATRDGVQKVILKDENAIATKSQQELIENIIKDFPKSKNSFEYEDYIENKTAKNASEFISVSLEQFASYDKKYLEYIANRPRVEKLSSHGLFTCHNSQVNLKKVMEDVSNHKGNIWTPIISLRREDAENTGFTNAESWKELISSKMFDMAKSMKITPENFRWYGAYHDEGNHPHVHLICYSTNPNEGYLTNDGIKKMKSCFVNEIFEQQLIPIYEQKTERRDALKNEAEKAIENIKKIAQTSDFDSLNIYNLLIALSKKLEETEGKKQYGYLKPNVKNIVNEIVDEIEKLPEVKEAYTLWQEIQDEIYHSYSDQQVPRVLLSEQKEFKSIKNMIIAEVLKFDDIKIISKNADDIAYTQVVENENYVISENFIPTTNQQVDNDNNSNTAKNIAPSVAFAVSNIFSALSNIFQDNTPKDSTTTHQKIDSKSLRKLRELKASKGLKHTGEDTETTYQQTMQR